MKSLWHSARKVPNAVVTGHTALYEPIKEKVPRHFTVERSETDYYFSYVANSKAPRFWGREKLGQGFDGVVYKAFAQKHNDVIATPPMPVAIKRLEDSQWATTDLEQHKAACELWMTLDSPYVARVYELLQVESSYYLVMEFLSGSTLAHRLPAIRSSLASHENQVRQIMRDMLQGLQYLQEQQVVHGDIKPENLMFDDYETLKFIDFSTSFKLTAESIVLANSGFIDVALRLLRRRGADKVSVNSGCSCELNDFAQRLENLSPPYSERLYAELLAHSFLLK